MSKRKKIREKKINVYIISLAIASSSLILIFNDFGLLKLIQLQKEHQELEHSLQGLLSQQEKLHKKIVKLQTDNEYIEKIARERFMMVLPGEKVYRVQERKHTKQ